MDVVFISAEPRLEPPFFFFKSSLISFHPCLPCNTRGNCKWQKPVLKFPTIWWNVVSASILFLIDNDKGNNCIKYLYWLMNKWSQVIARANRLCRFYKFIPNQETLRVVKVWNYWLLCVLIIISIRGLKIGGRRWKINELKKSEIRTHIYSCRD